MQHSMRIRVSSGEAILGLVTIALVLSVPLQAANGRNGTASELSLANLRQTVIENEAKASLLRMEYRLIAQKNGGPSRPRGRGSSPQRYDYKQLTYAQDDQRHHLTEASYSGEKRGFYRVQIVNGEVYKSGMLPDLMEGWIEPVKSFQWALVPPMVFAFRPYEDQLLLSECLTPECASQRPDHVMMEGREAAVVEIKRPEKKFLLLVWIDLERGLPLRLEDHNTGEDLVEGEPSSFCTSTKFHQLSNGGWIPVEGTAKLYVTRGGSLSEVTNQWTVDVNSISIDKKDIPDSLFDIQFPAGAKITNKLVGAVFPGNFDLVTDGAITGMIDDIIKPAAGSGENPPNSVAHEPNGMPPAQSDRERAAKLGVVANVPGSFSGMFPWISVCVLVFVFGATGVVYSIRISRKRRESP
jgi:hypothetical protein